MPNVCSCVKPPMRRMRRVRERAVATPAARAGPRDCPDAEVDHRGRIAVVVLAGAGFAFWYTQIRVESKPKASIKETPVDTVAPGSTPDGT